MWLDTHHLRQDLHVGPNVKDLNTPILFLMHLISSYMNVNVMFILQNDGDEFFCASFR
jgi:hypothetical protein